MDNLCGNKEVYENIKGWIENYFKENKEKISINSCIFISGNTGIGKTYSINKICELLDLYIINIDNNNCNSSEKIIEIINKSTSRSIYEIFTNNNKNKIIIIDELDTLLSIDRTISLTLLNILLKEKNKNIPIICICSPDILKKIGDIKKKCKIFELSNPNDKDIYNIINKMNINMNDIQIKTLIKKCYGNISQILKKIEVNFDNNNNNTYLIDRTYEIEYLYSPINLDREIIKKIINIDPWLIPLRFHENLINELNTNRKSPKTIKFVFYAEFMKNLCIFDNMMYNNIIDNAIDFFTCIILYELNKIPSKKNINLNMKNFTKILSYLSLQKKYIKQSYSMNFPLYQIGNYHTNIINRNFIYFN